jgi:hypothetical protein
MMTLEVISWSHFSNGMTVHFYNWSCSCPCRKGDQGRPPWAPAWAAAAGVPPDSIPELLQAVRLHGIRCAPRALHWSARAIGPQRRAALVSLSLGALRSSSATNPSQVSSSSSLHVMFSFLCTILLWVLFHTTHLGLEVPDNSYGRMSTTNQAVLGGLF